MKKTYVNWSSGKDAALALYRLQQDPAYQVEKLLTTMNNEVHRISMHGVREELLDLQVQQLDLPLVKLPVPASVSMVSYNALLHTSMKKFTEEGFTHAAFGDIFLEDLKEYREQQLTEAGLTGVFPLWKEDVKVLLKEFLALGFKAITVCVSAKHLDASFVGRIIDEDFINDLPEGVDPCGENGEFHTFVYDGPIFKAPVPFTIGEKVLRNYRPSKDNDDCFKDDVASWDTSFWFCDLLVK